MIDPSVIPDLADIAGRSSHREFNETVAALYEFDTEIGAVSRDEFLDLIEASATKDVARIDRLIVMEEVEAFAAYLRAMGRSRAVMRRLAGLDQD